MACNLQAFTMAAHKSHGERYTVVACKNSWRYATACKSFQPLVAAPSLRHTMDPRACKKAQFVAAPLPFRLLTKACKDPAQVQHVATTRTPSTPPSQGLDTTDNDILQSTELKRSPIRDYLDELGVRYVTFDTDDDPDLRRYTFKDQRMNEEEVVNFCRARGEAFMKLAKFMGEMAKGEESDIISNFKESRRHQIMGRRVEEDQEIPNLQDLPTLKLPKNKSTKKWEADF